MSKMQKIPILSPVNRLDNRPKRIERSQAHGSTKRTTDFYG